MQDEKNGKKRPCPRKCSTDSDCLNDRKLCLCDGACGMSCIRPEKECPELPDPPHGQVQYSLFFGFFLAILTIFRSFGKIWYFWRFLAILATCLAFFGNFWLLLGGATRLLVNGLILTIEAP